MRLLLIEDDPRLVRSLAAGLVERDFVVDIESDGPTGLAALLAHRYDACVLDVNLPTPTCDGFAVVRAARAASCPVPILLLTARDAIADRIHGLDQGADDYLVKPFAFAELLARLRALFRRGTPQRSALLHLGALTLDPAARELRIGERRIDVTQKQLALFEYLLRHRGEIVTRSMILSGVWGYSFDPGTNLVNVHIAHLRRRIEESGHACPIETVRGVGFRIPSTDREAHDRSS